MSVVYKYPLRSGNHTLLSLPQGAELLTVQDQRGTPTLWALVDPDQPKHSRMIRMFATGEDAPEDMDLAYIATAQFGNGLVYHFFEELIK